MRRVVLGVAVVLVLAYLLIAKAVSGENKTVQPSPGATAASATAQIDDPHGQSKLDPDMTVKKFVRAFYSRDGELLSGSSDEQTERFVARLQPYVTDRFLGLYVHPFNTSQDETLRRSGGHVVARVSKFVSNSENDSVLDRLTRIKFKVMWPGQPVQFATTSINVYMTFQNSAWRVEGFEDVP